MSKPKTSKVPLPPWIPQSLRSDVPGPLGEQRYRSPYPTVPNDEVPKDYMSGLSSEEPIQIRGRDSLSVRRNKPGTAIPASWSTAGSEIRSALNSHHPSPPRSRPPSPGSHHTVPRSHPISPCSHHSLDQAPRTHPVALRSHHTQSCEPYIDPRDLQSQLSSTSQHQPIIQNPPRHHSQVIDEVYSSSDDSHVEKSDSNDTIMSETAEDYHKHRGLELQPAPPEEFTRKHRRASFDLFPDWRNPAFHGTKIVGHKKKTCC